MSVLLYSFAAFCLLGFFIYLNKYSYWRKVYFKAGNGTDGTSAYDFAVTQGFVGTRQEWLDQVQYKVAESNRNHRTWTYYFKKVNLDLVFSLVLLALLFILINVLHIEGNITDLQAVSFILFIASGITSRKTVMVLREHRENQSKPYYNPSLSYMGVVIAFALITILCLVLGVIFLLS